MEPKETPVQNGNDNPSGSPTPAGTETPVEKTGDQGTPTPQENKEVVPNPKPDFHQDPAVQEYLNRQWENREKTLRDELTKEFETRFQPRNHPGDGDEKIPEWFGGTLEQWKSYKASVDEVTKTAEERAYQRFRNETESHAKAQKEANEFFESEVKAIEAESKVTVDRDKLIQTVIKYKLVDPETQRWNYRAAFEIIRGTATPNQDPNKDRKKLADATNKEGGGGEPEPKVYKTSEDFKKDRPW